MSVKLKKYSHRFAEEVFNGKIGLKNELDEILYNATLDLSVLSRPNFNAILEKEFVNKGWNVKVKVFDNDDETYSVIDYMKDRVGVKVHFGHPSFIGTDLLKFEIASYMNEIDFGVYIVTTRAFQKYLSNTYNVKWDGSLCFEKVIKYLPQVKGAIRVPIYVIGFDI